MGSWKAFEEIVTDLADLEIEVLSQQLKKQRINPIHVTEPSGSPGIGGARYSQKWERIESEI